MDLDYFLKKRLAYANYFFTNAVKPFEDIISSIEEQKPPCTPVYDESGEPPFLEEWIDANTGLESVGITALSMLSSSLQLFLNDWVARFETSDKKYKRTHKKRGWFYAYQISLEDIGINLENCPSNLELIEQVVLVRNRGQHPDHLTILNTSHSSSDMKKYPSPYFVADDGHDFVDEEGNSSWWSNPNIYVDHLKFEQVSLEIQKMCVWLESEYRSLIQ